MPKELNEQQIFLKLSSICASAEHCSYDMEQKMIRWQVPEKIQAKVIQRLIEERFIDDERYCRAFVHDKIRYNKWGQLKIEQALFQKHIDRDITSHVLDEIEDEEYLDVLRPLIKSKSKTIKAESEYEFNGKLIKFALSRGFTMKLIQSVIHDE